MMLLIERYVDVLVPGNPRAVLVYRAYDEADGSWGNLWKSFSRSCDSVEEAREWVNLFMVDEAWAALAERTPKKED
jgi:hypothetical protein